MATLAANGHDVRPAEETEPDVLDRLGQITTLLEGQGRTLASIERRLAAQEATQAQQAANTGRLADVIQRLSLGVERLLGDE